MRKNRDLDGNTFFGPHKDSSTKLCVCVCVLVCVYVCIVCTSAESAEGKMAHNNGWNGAN